MGLVVDLSTLIALRFNLLVLELLSFHCNGEIGSHNEQYFLQLHKISQTKFNLTRLILQNIICDKNGLKIEQRVYISLSDFPFIHLTQIIKGLAKNFVIIYYSTTGKTQFLSQMPYIFNYKLFIECTELL